MSRWEGRKRIFSGRPFKVLMTLVIFFLAVSLVSAGSSDVRSFLTNSWLIPLQQMTTNGTASLKQTLTPMKSAEELTAENSRLQEENRRLHDMLVDYYAIRREKEALEKFYGIKSAHQDFMVVVAAVIGRDPNENFYGFTLDKGSRDGVKQKDPVMTENGLVGWVCEVSSDACKVSTILSPEAGIGVTVQRTDDSGLLSGNVVLADEGLTRMVNLSAQHHIQTGDMVVTSGAGGSFPKHLKVGRVRCAMLDEYTGMPAAEIEPFEDIRQVSSVVIITAFG